MKLIEKPDSASKLMVSVTLFVPDKYYLPEFCVCVYVYVNMPDYLISY